MTAPWEQTPAGAAGQQGSAGLSDPGVPAQRGFAPSDPGRPPDRYPPAGPEQAGVTRRLAQSPFVGFIPWILYWVIGGPSTWETAAIAALLAAVLLAALSVEAQPAGPGPGPAASRLDFRRLKVLDVATIIFFAALVIVALVTSRSDVQVLDKYAQALSSGALGLIALGSILVGHPFTVDYAKEQAPPEVWHTAAFRQINLVLTAVWTVVFLVCAGLGLLAVHVHTKGLQDWLNWYIPIALIIVGIRLNSWYPDHVRSRIGVPARS